MGRLLDEDIVIDALIGISGSKSIEELTEECEVYQSDNRCWSGGVYGAIRAIKALSTNQTEPKEGEWVQIQRCTGDAQPDLECPFCKHRIGWFDMGRYCARCGAKLKGGAG